MSEQHETKLAVVDGRDAVAYVLIYPSSDQVGVSIDAGANGITHKQAAYVLRQVADAWDPPAASSGRAADTERRQG